MSTQTSGPMTRAQLLALPATVDLVTAGRAVGIGKTKAHEMARAGTFPVRVLRLGKAYRVPTAELLALLGVEPEPPTEHSPGCSAVPSATVGGGSPAA